MGRNLGETELTTRPNLIMKINDRPMPWLGQYS